jgi:hypothetical protein
MLMMTTQDHQIPVCVANHPFRPNSGSWCLGALAAAQPDEYREVFKNLNLMETLVLLKALNPKLRLHVIRALPLAPYIKLRIEKGLMI